MPWDGTELKVAEIGGDGSLGSPRTLLGGDHESVFQPDWAGTGSLYAVSDRSGWWNLYEVDLSGGMVGLCEREEEFGRAQWVFGMATHGVLGDGRIAVLHGRGTWSLGVLDPRDGGSATSGAEEGFTYFEPTLARPGSEGGGGGRWAADPALGDRPRRHEREHRGAPPKHRGASRTPVSAARAGRAVRRSGWA